MPFGSEPREPGVALALSGGGFRAVLFHLGALLRLDELGLLSSLRRISSISGGSIVAGVLARQWPALTADGQGRFTNLVPLVVEPLQGLCSQTLDVGTVLKGAFNPFRSAGDELVRAYRQRLGLDLPLKALLPERGPRFVFNATNYATGVSFRFSAPYCGDWRIGLMREHRFDLATAVAASSAFPPVFAPLVLDVDPGAFERVPGADLFDDEDFRRRLLLADGGVYDNLGLETVWGRYETVLVSDGGKPFELQADPAASLAQLARVADIGLNQALALRKRMLIEAFRQGRVKGTYWGIGTPVADYGLGEQALPVSPAATTALSRMRTRLNAFTAEEQERLINGGYAVCDAAVRAHAPALAAGAGVGRWPFPHRDMAT